MKQIITVICLLISSTAFAAITTVKPTEEPAYWIVRINDSAVHYGTTELGLETISGHQLIGVEGHNDFLSEILPYANEFPDLPDSGMLEEGIIYNWNGQAVIVRQSHERTIYDPDQTPALFLFYQEGAGTLGWIVGEQVEVGMKREYDGTVYSCIQPHVTQAEWTPDTATALWDEVQEGIEEWVQPTGQHDAYNTGDKVIFEGHIWESLIDANVWSPAVYPQGWTDLGAQ